MCEAVGHSVQALKRTEFAGLSLSGVKRGEHRACRKCVVAVATMRAAKNPGGGGLWKLSRRRR